MRPARLRARTGRRRPSPGDGIRLQVVGVASSTLLQPPVFCRRVVGRATTIAELPRDGASRLTVLNPATEQPIAELRRPASRRPTPPSRGRRPRSRPGGVRRATGRVCCGGSRRSSRSTARSSPGSSRENVGKPISGARGEVGMVAEVFHFYAGAVDKHHGETIPVARRDGRDVPRAARRRRPDRPLELPAQHRQLEARPRARLRQHGRAEAGGADAALGAAARRARARGRHPRGRRQRPRRPRLGRRQPARRASGRREDRLHRLDRGRRAR